MADYSDVVVPEGFTAEPDGYGRNTCIITSPKKYFATVDWQLRGFRSGITTSGQMINGAPFKGAGWKRRLVDAAVDWLRELEEKRAR